MKVWITIDGLIVRREVKETSPGTVELEPGIRVCGLRIFARPYWQEEYADAVKQANHVRLDTIAKLQQRILELAALQFPPEPIED